MELPEKIWVHELSAMELDVPMKEYGVEYIRTDSVIEKAAEWFRTHWRDYVGIDKDNVIRFGLWENDFRKYMKGE